MPNLVRVDRHQRGGDEPDSVIVSDPQVTWGLLRGWIRFAHHMVYTERSREACARNDSVTPFSK
mgnify:CR=1 FL=1